MSLTAILFPSRKRKIFSSDWPSFSSAEGPDTVYTRQ